MGHYHCTAKCDQPRIRRCQAGMDLEGGHRTSLRVDRDVTATDPANSRKMSSVPQVLIKAIGDARVGRPSTGRTWISGPLTGGPGVSPDSTLIFGRGGAKAQLAWPLEPSPPLRIKGSGPPPRTTAATTPMGVAEGAAPLPAGVQGAASPQPVLSAAPAAAEGTGVWGCPPDSPLFLGRGGAKTQLAWPPEPPAPLRIKGQRSAAQDHRRYPHADADPGCQRQAPAAARTGAGRRNGRGGLRRCGRARARRRWAGAGAR